MSYVPKNVKDRIALETSLQEAKAHADELQRGRNVADWHVKDARISTKREALGAPLLTNCLVAQYPVPGTTSTARQDGIKMGVEILKTARQARLKELYEREALAYEAELHGMGLSLVKPRQ
ncbi:flagellar associated protein [Haematococcus lacustris]